MNRSISTSRETKVGGAVFEEKPPERAPPALAFDELHIRGGRILLLGSLAEAKSSGTEPSGAESSEASALLRIEDVEARLRPRSGDAIATELSGRLAQGGRVTAKGTLAKGRDSPDGAVCPDR